MIRILRDFRLIPIVLTAIICLFVLKATGLVLDGGYMLGDPTKTRARHRKPKKRRRRTPNGSDPGRSKSSIIRM
jgi:hypothetical protein